MLIWRQLTRGKRKLFVPFHDRLKRRGMNNVHVNRGSSGGLGPQKGLKRMTVMMGLCLLAYIVGPPLYWHLSVILMPSFRSSSPSFCPPCLCDCSSQPLLSIPDALSNTSFTDCMNHDPDVSEEMEKSFTDLLSEEVRLKEEEAQKDQQRADVALLEAKKIASQYQKEADKCNAGMETCEGARERAEAALVAQKKLSEMWELRALQKGWKGGIRLHV